MKNHGSHPGRSVEFLSRLYDGELTAAERAHFESHRSRCAECRNAAAEFEAALSFYRSSHPSPPSPDLAQRILRKLQASTTRRSPFGIFFGIDLKWAGAFAAALIAVIIGSSVVLQQSGRREAESRGTPIPIVIQEEKEEKREADLRKRAAALAGERAPALAKPQSVSMVEDRDKASAFEARLPEQKDEVAPPQSRAGAPLPADGLKAMAEKESRKSDVAEGRTEAAAALGAAKMSEAVAPRQSKAPERAGGEGAAAGSATLLDQAAPAPPRLIVSAIDGRGTTPELSEEETPQLLTDLRGREYILTVNSQGRVVGARPADRKKTARADVHGQNAVQESKAPPAIFNLRFKPSDHPRLLLVRIE